MKLAESDIVDIVQLLRDTDFEDIELEWDDVYLRIARRSAMRSKPEPQRAATAPTIAAAAAKIETPTVHGAKPTTVAPGETAAPSGVLEVRSALMGTVYRAAQPGDPDFVEVGSIVSAGDTLCLLEVMKVFTALKTETSGIIERILISDGDLVQYNQVIFWIRPV